MSPRPTLVAAVAGAALVALAVFGSLRQGSPGTPRDWSLGPGANGAAVGEPPASRVELPIPGSTTRERNVAEAVPETAADGAATNAALITGRVLDARGAPIAGARVHALPADRVADRLLAPEEALRRDPAAGAAASTDRDGRFALPRPDRARLRLTVRAVGHAPRDEVIETAGEGEHSLGDLVMEDGHVLSGTVRTAAGAPVAGATLQRLDPENRSAAAAHAASGERLATSDAEGRFRVAELPAGRWRILVSASAHPDAVFEGSAEGPPGSVEERTFVLEEGARIEGRVTGPAESLAGLMVRAIPLFEGPEVGGGALGGTLPADAESNRPRAAPCAADGTFVVAGLLPERRYRIAAWKLGDDPSARPRTNDVVLTSGAKDVRLALESETVVRFRAVDGLSRAPIEEFEAHLVDEASGRLTVLSLTGSDGRVQRRFEGGRAEHPIRVPPAEGAFTLVVRARGYAPRAVPDLRPSAGASLELGDVALEPVPEIEVVVRSALDGSAIAGARVTRVDAEPAEGAAALVAAHAPAPPWHAGVTDAEGRARLDGSQGRFALDVRRPDHAPHVTPPLGPADFAGGAVEVLLAPREERKGPEPPR